MANEKSGFPGHLLRHGFKIASPSLLPCCCKVLSLKGSTSAKILQSWMLYPVLIKRRWKNRFLEYLTEFFIGIIAFNYQKVFFDLCDINFTVLRWTPLSGISQEFMNFNVVNAQDWRRCVIAYHLLLRYQLLHIFLKSEILFNVSRLRCLKYCIERNGIVLVRCCYNK